MRKIKPPSSLYTNVTRACLMLSIGIYMFGAWMSDMLLNEKGFYVICLFFALFAAISQQKIVREEEEDLFVSEKYKAATKFALLLSNGLFLVGLWNADLLLSEKGFFIMSFVLAMYSAASAQKNEADNRYAALQGTIEEKGVIKEESKAVVEIKKA